MYQGQSEIHTVHIPVWFNLMNYLLKVRLLFCYNTSNVNFVESFVKAKSTRSLVKANSKWIWWHTQRIIIVYLIRHLFEENHKVCCGRMTILWKFSITTNFLRWFTTTDITISSNTLRKREVIQIGQGHSWAVAYIITTSLW